MTEYDLIKILVGKMIILSFLPSTVFCPFPGFVENGKVLLVGAMGLYEYRPYVRKIRNNRQIMFQVYYCLYDKM